MKDDLDKFTCNYCKTGEFIINDNENDVCDNCGYIRKVYVEEKLFDEQYYLNNYIDYSPYTKLNHFQKTLSFFQAKQDKKINDKIISTIKQKYDENDILKINYENTRLFLKLLKLPKLYDHIFLINKKLGIQPFLLTNQEEEYMIYQFKEIHGLYSKHSINKYKSSFFNYYYIFYKFCQMNGLTKFLPFIPMLKTKLKIIEHEELFKSICEELNWEFIPIE